MPLAKLSLVGPPVQEFGAGSMLMGTRVVLLLVLDSGNTLSGLTTIFKVYCPGATPVMSIYWQGRPGKPRLGTGPL